MYDVTLHEALFPAQTDSSYEERTIAATLREQAELRPQGLALREVLPDGAIGREWSYAALLADCEKVGRALAKRHPRGTRIAIMGGNCPEWVLVELGAALAGLCVVTVNPAFIAREVRYVVEQSRSEAVYYQSHVRGTPLRPIIDDAVAGLASIRYLIDMEDHAALFSGEGEGELRPTRPDDVVMMQYTSGTTGFPKGVLLHQHGLVQSNRDLMARWNLRPEDELVCPFPLFHTAGSAVSVIGSISQGATLLLVSVFDPGAIVTLIEREKPAVVGGVPTMLFTIIEAARESGITLQGVRSVVSGGAMVSPELNRAANEVFGVPINIVYGQTETSPAITATWPDDCEQDLLETIGQPIPHVEVSIRDTGTNAVCELDTQGEICVRGYNVMTGYNDDPDATAATIDKQGWLHTGDLGSMDSRGFVKITGRVKEMIIRGGENLFPAEIENAILEHPAIAEVAVAGIPDEKWGELVGCFMRSAAGAPKPSVDELRAFTRERLSPQKTPAHWVWVEEWPMTGSGKIQKFALAEAFVEGRYEQAPA